MKSVEYFGADKLTLPKELSFELNLDFKKIKDRTIYLNDRNLNAKGSLLPLQQNVKKLFRYLDMVIIEPIHL